MMIKMLFALLLYVFSVKPAHAADTLPLINTSDCQYLIEYQQPDDVEYKAGVDVHGKPVVEADINSSAVTMPEKFSFDVTIDMAQYLGISAPMGTEMQGKIGTITVEKGKILFNDKPLEGDAVAALQSLCKPKPLLQNTKKVNYNQ